MSDPLLSLQRKIGYTFNDVGLLTLALTHRSFSGRNNERLEFLGDAVLELAVSKFLYRKYPQVPEGKLTKLRAAIVCEESLAKFAKECRFDQSIRLGKGEEHSGGRNRPALLCDLFEAFLGALYLDQGFEAVETFLEKVVFPKILAGAFSHEMDHKTRLQEVLQRSGDVLIDYRLIKEEGPAHERQFWTQVYFNGEKIGEGQGKSKKLAEQAAAANALNQLLD